MGDGTGSGFRSKFKTTVLFAPSVITDTWNAHQAGRGNHEHQLWAILMFQSWWKANRPNIEA